jgi:hypothetical protein
MVNLFDIMRNAQAGAGLQNLSRQFGLSPVDTQRALDVLLPAFSLSFQRLVHDPKAFAPLLQMVASGQYAPFFDAPATLSAASLASGSDVLSRLMGSKEASRRVAEQAAAATGMGVDILQQMLPMVAATLIGGAFRYASLEGMSDLFARWSDAFRQAHAAQAPSPPRPDPANPFEMWTSLFNLQPPARTPPPAAPPQNPAAAWSAMVDAGWGGAAAPNPRAPPPPPNPVQILAQMFEAGTQAQAQYVEGLKASLDHVWNDNRPSPSAS